MADSTTQQSKRPRGKTLGLAALARELGVSRQYVWQLMQKHEGLCIYCSQPIFSSGRCRKHFLYHRLRKRVEARKKYGWKPKRKGAAGRPLKKDTEL